MTLTKNALDVRVAYTDELYFDECIVDMFNKVIKEIVNNPKLVAVGCKHYKDPRFGMNYIEILLDEKE